MKKKRHFVLLEHWLGIKEEQIMNLTISVASSSSKATLCPQDL